MSDLRGLADFQAPIAVGSSYMFAPFGAGSYNVLPREFSVAQEATGGPDFALVMLRRADDLSAAGQYAVLDMTLAANFPLDDALAAARAATEGATVRPISISAGFARLYPAARAVALPPDASAPVPLGMAGPDRVRWTTRLALESGEIIKGALAGETLLLGARIDIEVVGVAPRVALTVQFTPGALVDAALAGCANRQIGAEDLLAFFKRPLSALPVKVVGSLSPSDANRFAAAMADRMIGAYGKLVPGAGPGDPPLIELDAGVDAQTVNREWTLGEPVPVPRYWTLTLDPLQGLRAAAGGQGLAKLVREVTVPPLALGLWSVAIAANLPSVRVSVPAIGVTAAVPAAPPLRPIAINQSLNFEAPDDTGTLNLRLAPEEPLRYSLTPFALIATEGSVRRYTGTERQFAESWVQLQAADFPVTFAHLTASARLLKLADLSGTLSYTLDGKSLQQAITLTAVQPDMAVAVPTEASDACVALSATPKDGGAALAMPPQPPGRLHIDVTSFPEYGPHSVELQCRFAGRSGLLAVELVGEDDVADPGAVATLAMTSEQPSASWGYVASSPFRAGYRYRKAAAMGEPPGPWVAVPSPVEPLVLAPDGTRVTTTAAGGSDPIAFDINDVHFFAKPASPGALYYLPARPSPERDGQSPPKLMLIRSAQSAILQLGTQFGLDASELAAARASIAAARPELAQALLQPAAIRVRTVRVLLTDAGGAPQELKRASSSGYPPYTTVFSITLAPDQAAQAIAAINGRSGLLLVEYEFDLPDELAATLPGAPSSLTRRADVASWFPGDSGASHLLLAS